MSCLHPLIAFPSRKLSKNGKVQYIPVKTTDAEYNNYHNKEWLSEMKKIGNPPIFVPCGKCINCRLEYARNWAYRCMMELKYHKEAYFITLTYNDMMIPKHYYMTESGEKLPAYSLDKEDFQKWLKRLRKKISDEAKVGLHEDYKIRFFGCGEYGSDTLRPHYHCIVFGLHLDDLKLYKNTESGALYTSKWLQETWMAIDKYGNKRDKGFVVVGAVNFDTCAYVARYTAKKAMTVDLDFWKKFNLEVPFVEMSRRPGIGLQYFYDNPNLFDSGTIHLSTIEKGYSFSIPKYFLKKLESEDVDLYDKIVSQRKLRGSTFALALSRSSKIPYSEYLKTMEDNMVSRSKAIKRNVES